MNDTTPFEKVRAAAGAVAAMSDDRRSAVLCAVADAIDSDIERLLAANAEDLSKMDINNPLYDRLMLTPERLHAIASDMRHVAGLPCPVGEEIESRSLANGLKLRRVRVPFGVIGVIYEARPNVTFDVFAICFKSANACVLKGGKDADSSNSAAVALTHRVLTEHGIDPNAVTLMPSTHEATADMLNAVGYIDVCIPRGGRRLIDFVRDNARIPVIETGAGVVHVYVHRDANIDIAVPVVTNAKTRRVSVCNALDTLLIDNSRLSDLQTVVAPLAARNVRLYADSRAFSALSGNYPDELLGHADDSTWDTEWMDYKMGVRTVDGLDDAIAHVARHGSGHSEAIITDDANAACQWQSRIDAACVYVNAPTSFTDGGQFGLGAEIGISTQKLGPRGPMGLREMTTYRWLINGYGQTRP